MKILVCVKQVPGSNNVEVDPVTGVLKRSGIPSKCNPYDLYGIETALSLAERFGGTVESLTMGPPQAKAVIQETVCMGAFAGDCEQAHLAGAEFLKELCQSEKVLSDIVITTNNGHPLDQNIYQAVKGMTAGEATCADGGVIIMAAACADGHGGQSFMETITQSLSPAQILAQIQSTPKKDTVPDQWESQILARILSKYHVVLISQADPALVSAMKMHPARDIGQALEIAEQLLGRKGTVTVIPEGISTIIR